MRELVINRILINSEGWMKEEELDKMSDEDLLDLCIRVSS
jgi:hypothetical protein